MYIKNVASLCPCHSPHGILLEQNCQFLRDSFCQLGGYGLDLVYLRNCYTKPKVLSSYVLFCIFNIFKSMIHFG